MKIMAQRIVLAQMVVLILSGVTPLPVSTAGAEGSPNYRTVDAAALPQKLGTGVPNKPSEAFRRMRITAKRGDPRAQYSLGTYYYQGFGTRVDRPSAAVWFRKSAEKGFAEAQLAYGMLLLSGDGIAQDKARAIKWFGKAARQGNGRAKEVLRELLTYRGHPAASQMTDAAPTLSSGKPESDSQLRLEGKGVFLHQGSFGLKFSLPNLKDANASPQEQSATRPLRDNLQGGTFDIIFRTSP